MRSVGLDEAHEMMVNKDLKTTVPRPTKEYINRIIHYYPVRAQALKSLKQQVLLYGLEDDDTSSVGIIDSTKCASKVEENILVMISKLKSMQVLDTLSVYPLQSLSGQLATSEQEKDLLSFWDIGFEQFKNKVNYFILNNPSADIPQRKVKLLTYAVLKESEAEDQTY